MAGSIPPPDLPEVTSCSRALHALGVLKLSLGEGNPKKKMPHLEGGVLLKKRGWEQYPTQKEKRMALEKRSFFLVVYWDLLVYMFVFYGGVLCIYKSIDRCYFSHQR